MKLLLRGRDRYELDHTLIDNDISKVKSPEPDMAPGVGLLIMPPSASGELGIVAEAENVSLNGNFKVTIRLTKDEIANLARIAFAEDSFPEVVDALSRGAPLKTSTLKYQTSDVGTGR